jgi:hypothetical protein
MSDAIDVADRYLSHPAADDKRGAFSGMKKEWDAAIRKVSRSRALIAGSTK